MDILRLKWYLTDFCRFTEISFYDEPISLLLNLKRSNYLSHKVYVSKPCDIFFKLYKRRLFEDAGRVSFVDLQDHGRATIRFESAYDAERAVGRFNGYMIEGHALLAHITD